MVVVDEVVVMEEVEDAAEDAAVAAATGDGGQVWSASRMHIMVELMRRTSTSESRSEPQPEI